MKAEEQYRLLLCEYTELGLRIEPMTRKFSPQEKAMVEIFSRLAARIKKLEDKFARLEAAGDE